MGVNEQLKQQVSAMDLQDVLFALRGASPCQIQSHQVEVKVKIIGTAKAKFKVTVKAKIKVKVNQAPVLRQRNGH